MEFLDSKSYRDKDGVGYYFGKDYHALVKATSLQKNIRDTVLKASTPGITTLELHKLALKLITDAGAEPLFMGYGGFPHSICISINDQIVHGTAGSYTLKDGDLLSLDLGVRLEGYCADSCRTINVGNKKKGNYDQELIEVAEKAFLAALEVAKPGNTVGDLGYAIFKEILEPKDPLGNSLFNTIPHFMGHGIGHELHENPQVPNYGSSGFGKVLMPGMCICIEPIVIHYSSHEVKSGVFTISSHDGKHSSHYENQVYISESGPQVLT